MALAYAMAGFEVHPLFYPEFNSAGRVSCSCGDAALHNKPGGHKSVGKHPRTDYTTEATRQREVITRLWTETPEANIGVCTGAIWSSAQSAYVVVIDVDSPHAHDALIGLCPDLPPTFQVTTGRGYHLYFASDVLYGPRNYLFKEAGSEGVDVRGRRGYVLGAGSRHYSGLFYEVDHGDINQLAHVPPTLAGFLVPYSERPKQSCAFSPEPAEQLILTEREEAILLRNEGVGGRSDKNAFASVAALLRRSDDPSDEAIAATIQRYPDGGAAEFYQEKGEEWALDDIDRIRGRVEDQTAENESRLAAHEEAARHVLRPGPLKVLLGLHELARKHPGRFTAAQAEIAIAAGVSKTTAAKWLRYLLDDGWIAYVQREEPGSRHASIYRISQGGVGQQASSGSRAIYSGSSLSQASRSLSRRPLGPVSGDGAAPEAGVGSVAAGTQGDNEVSSMAPEGDGVGPPKQRGFLDVSNDAFRYGGENLPWSAIQLLSYRAPWTRLELQDEMNCSYRTLSRYLARLRRWELVDESQGIRLVTNWREKLKEIAERKGTAGMKATAEKRLAEDRGDRRRRGELMREIQLAIQDGQLQVHADGRVVDAITGEVLPEQDARAMAARVVNSKKAGAHEPGGSAHHSGI